MPRLFAAIVAALLLAAPAADAADPELSGFLTDYSMLEPGPKDGVDLIWMNPEYKFPDHLRNFGSILIEPVTVYLNEDGKDRGIPIEELNKLANSFRTEVVNALSDRYVLAEQPGPGVLRVFFAITDIDTSMPVLDTITSVMPTARALSFVKSLVTGDHSFVGSASIEGLLIDGRTGESLVAIVDRRSGDKGVFGAVDSMEDVDEAFEWWAQKFRAALDESRL